MEPENGDLPEVLTRSLINRTELAVLAAEDHRTVMERWCTPDAGVDARIHLNRPDERIGFRADRGVELDQLTELASSGVHVLSSAPGPVRTGFEERADMRYDRAESPRTVARQSLAALGRAADYERAEARARVLEQIGSASCRERV